MIWTLLALLSAQQAADGTNNPVFLHRICVEKAVGKFVRSGEASNSIADAALARCAIELNAAVEFTTSEMSPESFSPAQRSRVRQNAREQLSQAARQNAVLKAMEYKSN